MISRWGESPDRWRFVGRAVESDRLDAALARATEGTPNVVLVGGEAGDGNAVASAGLAPTHQLAIELAARGLSRGQPPGFLL